MKYTLHHYSGRGLAKALHRSNNKTCTIQFPSRRVCVCVCPLQHRCGFQGCLSAESVDDLIWVDQLNHTFYSAVAHTSDRDLTTQNPASLSNFYTPHPLNPKTSRLSDSCRQMNQLTSDRALDITSEASVTSGGEKKCSHHVTLCCLTLQSRPEQSKYVTENSMRI